MTTLQQVRDQHVPSYRRKRLGMGSISGRQLWATVVRCSCGWECNINQPQRGAEKDWKDHTREEWNKLRHPAPCDPSTAGAVLPADEPASDPQWQQYLHWQERQKQVAGCPCCGAKAHWRQADKPSGTPDSVACSGCGLTMTGTDTIGSALEKWNKRT